MSIQSFFKSSTRQHAVRRRPTAGRPVLEALEDRCLLTFSPAVMYPAGTGYQDAVTADFNNDGRLDLAVVYHNTSNVSVLLGNVDGTFQAPLDSFTLAGPLTLAAGDFDADGQLDLVTAHSDEMRVLLGNGNGTFQLPTRIAAVPNVQSLAVGDFNSDGLLDLGAAGYSVSHGAYGVDYTPHAHVLLGDGHGVFPTLNALPFDEFSSLQLPAAVADFNGDGVSDFALGIGDGDAVGVLLGDGSGHLRAPTAFAVGQYPSALATGDVDGDGDIDLVTANPSGNNVSVLLGDGLGNFGAAQHYAIGDEPRTMQLGDFNHDGHLDIVTANRDSADLTVLLGLGNGTFATPPNSFPVSAPYWIVAGDFNGDGWLDVATAPTAVAVLINDQSWPPPGAPTVSINDVTVTEGNSGSVNATFTVRLSGPSQQPISVDFGTANGTALAGSDYQSVSGTLIFDPGELTQTVTVPVLGDRLAEPRFIGMYEEFVVNLSNLSNVSLGDGRGVATIIDNEPAFTGSDVLITEGNSGTKNAVFTFTMAGSSDGPVTVTWSTVDASAQAGSDYQAASGVLTFNPGGPLTKTVSVPVIGDRLVDPVEESFYVFLGSGDSAYATIQDDEPLLSISDASVVERNSGAVNAIFTVSLSRAYDEPVTVDFSTAEGDTAAWSGWGYYAPPAATAGSDFQAQSGTVTFAPGETRKTISVVVNGDRHFEDSEYFSVDFTGASFNAGFIDTHAVGIIVDDEPRISISDVSKSEGKSRKSTLFTFTVTLSAAYDQAVTMSFRTVDGTATTGDNDYVARTGTLTFAPGETTKTITVEVKGDSKREANETFCLDLFDNSLNSLFTKKRGIGTILNDD